MEARSDNHFCEELSVAAEDRPWRQPRPSIPRRARRGRALGYEPTDREFEKLGYDIESRIPGTGRLKFSDVKGRVADAATVTVTKNEILCSLNRPDDFILTIVEFRTENTHQDHYLRRPFHHEPDFGVEGVNYDLAELLARSEQPR